MPDINHKDSHAAKRCVQRPHFANFIEMINAMLRFIWEIDDSLPTSAQMPINVVHKRLCICHML
jgi:hypothetical protein